MWAARPRTVQPPSSRAIRIVESTTDDARSIGERNGWLSCSLGVADHVCQIGGLYFV